MRPAAWYAPLVASLCLVCCSAPAADAAKTVELFNGRTLDNWTCHVVTPGVKLDDVWQVKEGVMVCKGEPLGYLATKDSFKDFELSLEWRWAPGQKPGNSGVLLRISSPPVGFMPRCVEAQLKSGSAGDIWAFRGFKLTGPADKLRKVEKHKELGDFVGVGKLQAAENEPGQWNTYVITLDGDRMTVVVNGRKVNEATGCDVVAGPIGLQSEGGEIHFRNVTLRPLSK